MGSIPVGFRPMLASKLPDGEMPKFPCLVSPKLDGVRAVVFGGVVYSRKLKPIPNKWVQELFGKLEGFDGELIVGEPTGKDVFNRTQSGVMSVEGRPDVTFHVFDDARRLGRGEGFHACVKRLADDVRRIRGVVVQVVQQVLAHDAVGLRELEEGFLSQGYEGAMVRSVDGPYKYGRSTVREGYLLKVKRFCDSEAVVLGVEELERNGNAKEVDALGLSKRSTKKAGKVGAGTLGNLLARDLVTGVEFSVGSGFDSATRDALWAQRGSLTGRAFRYTYFPVGEGEAPRFPVFVGWRDERDIGEVA